MSFFKLCTLFVLIAVCTMGSPVTMNCPGGLQDASSNPNVTFGGSGIPKDAVCSAVIGGVELMLTATQRFDNLPVTNDGLTTFFAGTGDDAAHGQPGYAQWNFNFYARNTGSTEYLLELLWDTHPAFGTDTSDHGKIVQQLAPNNTIQNSWNLGMTFIDTGVAIPGVYSPATTLFSPYVAGNHTFGLNLKTLAGADVGGIGMQVNVGDVVPEPSTYLLMSGGLLGLVLVRRRRAK